jgi:FkbM family methyltransferase
MIKRLIKPGDVIVDVGANVGYYSVHLSNLVGESGFVHAFEPDPKNYARLVRNLQLNGFDKRSRANQMAVSSSTGTAQFILTPAIDSGWGRVAESAPAAGEQTINVQTTKLDDYLQSQNVRSVSFLKCDIEGHEFDFLAGAARTLEARAIGKVLIEYNGFNLNPKGRSVAEFVELFERNGYRPIEINLDRVEKSRQQRIANDRDTYNLLFEKAG